MLIHVCPHKRKRKKENYEFNFKTEPYKFIYLQTAIQLSQFMEYERIAQFPGKQQLIMPLPSSTKSTPPHYFSKFIFVFPKYY